MSEDSSDMVDDKRFDFFGFLNALIESGLWAIMGLCDRGVILVLMRFANIKSGQSWPTLPTIAKLAGCSRQSVQAAIQRHHTAGLVDIATWRQGRKKRKVYTLRTYKSGQRTIRADDAYKSAQRTIRRNKKGQFSVHKSVERTTALKSAGLTLPTSPLGRLERTEMYVNDLMKKRKKEREIKEGEPSKEEEEESKEECAEIAPPPLQTPASLPALKTLTENLCSSFSTSNPKSKRTHYRGREAGEDAFKKLRQELKAEENEK